MSLSQTQKKSTSPQRGLFPEGKWRCDWREHSQRGRSNSSGERQQTVSCQSDKEKLDKRKGDRKRKGKAS